MRGVEACALEIKDKKKGGEKRGEGSSRVEMETEEDEVADDRRGGEGKGKKGEKGRRGEGGM